MRYMKPSFLCFVLLSSVSVHAYAQATEADDQHRMVDGLRAFKSGDYARAARLLSEDLSVHPWPTVAYYAGLAHEKSEKLVEAAELYRRAAALAPRGTGEELKLERKAQSDAAGRLAALEPRIAQLTLHIEPGTSQGVTVTLDGASVPVASLSESMFLLPGSHSVAASAQCGDQDASEQRSVTLARGQHEQLTLNLQCPAPPAPSHPSTVGSGPAAAPMTPPAEPERARIWRTVGWVGVGVGSAALAASAVTAAAGESIRADGCNEDNECDSRDDVDTYKSLRSWSTVGFWVGLPVLAAGVGALLWDNYQQQHVPKDRGVTAWVGLGSVGLSGRFE